MLVGQGSLDSSGQEISRLALGIRQLAYLTFAKAVTDELMAPVQEYSPKGHSLTRRTPAKDSVIRPEL